MKNLFQFRVFVFVLFLQVMAAQSVAQSAGANSSALVSTGWRMVKNLSDSLTHDRTIYFKKNFTFSTLNPDGSMYNGGNYSVMDAKTFVTVHYGSQSACLYNFKINNDTLRFKGHYVEPYFDRNDSTIGFEPIDEVWVKIKDWVDEDAGILFSDADLLSTVLEKAAKENKMIFMDCYTTWCGPCKYLSNNVFPQKKVGDFYNKNFLNVSFDMETPEGRRIQARYGVKAYPTLLFLNPKGEVEHKSIGAGMADYMLEIGKTALDSTRNLQALKQKIKNGDRSAETLLDYLPIDYYGTDKAQLLGEHFKGKTLQQRLTKNSWELFKRFENDIQSPQFLYFAKHRAGFEKKFGKAEVNDKIWRLLENNKSDSVKYNAIRKVDPALYKKHKLANYYQLALAHNKAKVNKNDTASWNNLLLTAKKYFALEGIEPWDYNNLSRYIYENYKTHNDTAALKQAREWQQKLLKLNPGEPQWNDTYAHILFELGDVQQAIQYEEIALKKGQELKSKSLKFYSDELERFRKALQ